MLKILGHVNDPEAAISSHLDSKGQGGVALSWDIQEYWKKNGGTIQLAAMVYFNADHINSDHINSDHINLDHINLDHKGKIECVISDEHSDLLQAAGSVESYQDFVNLSKDSNWTRLRLDQPLFLQPLYIPKPWGQEIWYSGIEERGVCCADNIPLPWLLSMAPQLITGADYKDPILLKVLDPHASPVFGDLYFEMHDKKKEVYLVTHIDDQAWPDGKGAIRYGFNREKLSQYSSTEAFLSAYKQAVTVYRQTRDTIDSHLNETRKKQGISSSEVVDPEITIKWLSALPASLIEEEQMRRETMDSFTQLRSLELGETVQVPPLTPHSLQHGVRVVEFQTPHYERYILSFAQKVLTQDHWDTEEALTKVQLEPGKEQIDLISDADGCKVERIVTFDQFSVYRISLEEQASYPAEFKTYCLLMGFKGTVEIGGKKLGEGDACYLTALSMSNNEAMSNTLFNKGKTTASFLLAVPGTSGFKEATP